MKTIATNKELKRLIKKDILLDCTLNDKYIYSGTGKRNKPYKVLKFLSEIEIQGYTKKLEDYCEEVPVAFYFEKNEKIGGVTLIK